ncbi:MAG: hypothetical protein LBM65_03565 [Oscillospiraceae bacterium]|jgi:hypothetical protein|nr:hypothetical protein [Oscillospiraceae bacterium]
MDFLVTSFKNNLDALAAKLPECKSVEVFTSFKNSAKVDILKQIQGYLRFENFCIVFIFDAKTMDPFCFNALDYKIVFKPDYLDFKNLDLPEGNEILVKEFNKYGTMVAELSEIIESLEERKDDTEPDLLIRQKLYNVGFYDIYPLFSIYDILNLYNIDDFNCYAVQGIVNEKQIENAIEWLGEGLQKYLPQILEIAADKNRLYKLCDLFFSDVKTFSKDFSPYGTPLDVILKYDNNMIDLKYFYDIYKPRLLTGAHFKLQQGKFAKGYKKLAATKKLLFYEKRLLEFLKSTDFSPPPFLPQSIKEQATAAQGQINGIKPLIAVFIPYIPYMILCSLPFIGLFLLFTFIITRDALICLSPDFIGAGMFPGFIIGLLLCFYSADFFYKKLFKKSYAQFAEIEEAGGGKSTAVFLRRFCAVLAVISVIFVAMLANQNIAFYEDGFSDNSTFFAYSGEFYHYNEVDYVKAEPYADFDDVKTYTLIFRDGKKLNISEFSFIGGSIIDTEEKIKNEVLPLLQRKGIAVISE